MYEKRIGVFICHCGSNIAGHLDCAEVTGYAAGLPGVVLARENLYTCSESGIAEIQKAIREKSLNRVVVASCSPRTHQPLFQSSCAQAGLNPYLFEMANIRDQCSWVHMQERGRATEKAKDLVRMAVAKAALLEPRQDIEAPVISRAAVIGGGVAGLSAADTLAGLGVPVVLIEKASELGGLLNRLHRLAPSEDRAADRIRPLIDRVSGSERVKVYLEAEVEKASGYIGNYELEIRDGGGERHREQVGCIVVATGAVPLRPDGLHHYDGRRVITQMELEERLESGESLPARVVMIQCVGARTPERAYCSRVCCLTAVKNALLIRERNPEARVHILYRDLQMYGIEHEKMLWEARGRGVRFELAAVDPPPTVGESGVLFQQALMGEPRELPADWVVLSTPLVAPSDAERIARLLRIPVDGHGFFLEAHAKLRPLDCATDGIFLCGSARYPATAAEARTQGIGTASRAAAILFKDRRVTSGLVGEINAATCVGCRGCLEGCPYGAIIYLPDRRVCEVNPILCKGCGNCAASCPSQSAVLQGFRPEQLAAQIRAA